jgi:hypothetical protein
MCLLSLPTLDLWWLKNVLLKLYIIVLHIATLNGILFSLMPWNDFSGFLRLWSFLITDLGKVAASRSPFGRDGIMSS